MRPVPKLPQRLMSAMVESSHQISGRSVSREHRAVRLGLAGPAVRPGTLGEAETDLSVHVAESLIDRELARPFVKREQIHALARPAGSDDESLRF